MQAFPVRSRDKTKTRGIHSDSSKWILLQPSASAAKALWLVEPLRIDDSPFIGLDPPRIVDLKPRLGGNPDRVEYYGPGFNPEAGVGDVEIWLPVKKSWARPGPAAAT